MLKNGNSLTVDYRREDPGLVLGHEHGGYRGVAAVDGYDHAGRSGSDLARSLESNRLPALRRIRDPEDRSRDPIHGDADAGRQIRERSDEGVRRDGPLNAGGKADALRTGDDGDTAGSESRGDS